MSHFLNQIRQAIDELEYDYCRKENLLIAMSPIVERQLFQRAFFEEMPFSSSHSFKVNEFEGIKISNLWPYNEIVVYDVVKACLNNEDRYIKKIQINV